MSVLELPQLTKGEQRIRKIWYFLNLTLTCFILLLGTVSLCLLQLGGEPGELMGRRTLVMLAIGALVILQYKLQYHCIYKKQGTALLSFFIGCFTLSVLFNLLGIIAFLVLAIAGQRNESLGLLIATQIPTLTYEFLMLALMFKLRYVNKKCQFQKHSYDGYTQALDELKQAPNLEELKLTHQRLREKWSSFKIVLKRAFKERQKELQKEV